MLIVITDDIVTWQLKDGIVESIKAAKQVSAATNQHATKEELLKPVFSMQSELRLHNREQQKMDLGHM